MSGTTTLAIVEQHTAATIVGSSLMFRHVVASASKIERLYSWPLDAIVPHWGMPLYLKDYIEDTRRRRTPEFVVAIEKINWYLTNWLLMVLVVKPLEHQPPMPASVEHYMELPVSPFVIQIERSQRGYFLPQYVIVNCCQITQYFIDHRENTHRQRPIQFLVTNAYLAILRCVVWWLS